MKNIVLIALLATSTVTFAADAIPSATSAAVPVPAARGPALDLSIEAAKVAIEACAAKGGQKIAVSIVDSAGILKAVLAADGTLPRGVLSSNNKAVTALTFKSSTGQLGEQVKTDKVLAEKIAADSHFNVRPGGVLLKVNDEIIGAIGVGGGRTDEECALAGIERIQARLL